LAYSVDHYPEEDEKLRASSLTRRRGGNCPNSLEVIQQLINLSQSKLSLNLISVFPALESASTRFIKQTLGPDVNYDSCIYREDSSEPASAYVINSQRTGSRTIVSYNELSQMTLDEFSSSVELLGYTEKTCFHFEVCLVTVYASSHISEARI
jgi:ketohexokinase